jgi:DNA (cytosine-5)-methyltransferase 1
MTPRLKLDPDELIVDLFAGGGGASTGIEEATGRHVDIAVNHNPDAIAMHAANHPFTRHLCESVFDVNPLEVCGGRRVGLLWASPDCTHFSKAKGGKPRSKKIRGLAWVVVTWARTVAPRVICLENVEEFATWGPLDDDNKPIPSRAGETFDLFVSQLRELGYVVDWQIVVCADLGAPTTRKRLFLVARRDGAPIVWPAATHVETAPVVDETARRRRQAPRAWRTAAECIDWSIPTLSIFASPAEAKAWAREVGSEGIPRRPLAEATQRRIAAGVKRYVLDNPRPFIVTTGHQSSDAGKVRGVDQPLSTVVTKAEHLLVSPTLIQTGYGEREGQAPRILNLHKPLGTVVAGGGKHALVAAFLAKHNGSGETWNAAIGSALDEPMHTVTGRDTKALVTAFVARYHGERRPGESARVECLDSPLPTVTTENRFGLVAAFLCKYYGSDIYGAALDEPLDTIVTKARFGLVTVTIGGECYAIVDIGMRMLQPRELALAQGFPPSYILTGTKENQTARIGNSVCPPVASAIVRAQLSAPSPRRRPAPRQMPMFCGDQEAA